MGARNARSACRNGAAPPCEQHRRDSRWSSLRSRETREGRARMERRRHADNATWTLDGAPYGATKRARGAPMRRRRRANCTSGAS
eukprot:487582-Pyramimonas_sp.AAC.1